MTTVGRVWMIQAPPSNCRLMAYCVGTPSTKARAPTLTMRESSFAIRASSAGVAAGFRYSLYMLRVKRFAAAIDMIGRHQGADGDGGEGHPHEPGREVLQHQGRHGEVVAVLSEVIGVGRV